MKCKEGGCLLLEIQLYLIKQILNYTIRKTVLEVVMSLEYGLLMMVEILINRKLLIFYLKAK
jgi:hypothetical protein